MDRTDTGRATVQVSDVNGILDPTNPSGPYYGLLEPLLQAALARFDPVRNEWRTRFRGFIEDYTYDFDPSQRVNRLTVTLVDIYEILANIQMMPGTFGDTPPPSSTGQVFFEDAHVDDRIIQILTNAGISAQYYVVFSGNVFVMETKYSPGEPVLGAIQEAVDAEWPGVSNLFCDRFGRLCFHGRLAKFDPSGTAASADPGAWDYNNWTVGDGAAVAAAPSATAQIRSFAFNRGLSKVINQALATPLYIDDDDVAGQMVEDLTSQGQYGIRSWSAQNLITQAGVGPTTALEETLKVAEFYIANYASPRNRITEISFASMRPPETRAAPNWELLCDVDISDGVDVTIDSPGGGGFTGEGFFVEGVHETANPLNANYDAVTVNLDLSPRAYFTTNPWAE